jgi:NMD protein affecting ribosome stability and mRNA decay
MKSERGGFRMIRREQLLQELVHDSYRPAKKLKGATVCPQCGLVFGNGRWTRDAAPDGARKQRCPACQRANDRFPAGYVTLEGPFLREHREEITRLVRNCEAKENAEHPLERILSVSPSVEGVEVTTTGTHLAREIAERVHDAYKGELQLNYSREDHLLRARWRR